MPNAYVYEILARKMQLPDIKFIWFQFRLATPKPGVRNTGRTRLGTTIDNKQRNCLNWGWASGPMEHALYDDYVPEANRVPNHCAWVSRVLGFQSWKVGAREIAFRVIGDGCQTGGGPGHCGSLAKRSDLLGKSKFWPLPVGTKQTEVLTIVELLMVVGRANLFVTMFATCSRDGVHFDQGTNPLAVVQCNLQQTEFRQSIVQPHG